MRAPDIVSFPLKNKGRACSNLITVPSTIVCFVSQVKSPVQQDISWSPAQAWDPSVAAVNPSSPAPVLAGGATQLPWAQGHQTVLLWNPFHRIITWKMSSTQRWDESLVMQTLQWELSLCKEHSRTIFLKALKEAKHKPGLRFIIVAIEVDRDWSEFSWDFLVLKQVKVISRGKLDLLSGGPKKHTLKKLELFWVCSRFPGILKQYSQEDPF